MSSQKPDSDFPIYIVYVTALEKGAARRRHSLDIRTKGVSQRRHSN
jgi:hypothetical protein